MWYPGKKAKEEKEALLIELKILRLEREVQQAEHDAYAEADVRYLAAIKQAEEEEKQKKSKHDRDKERATAQGRAYFRVVNVEVDPENINNGTFEFDWNTIFIDELRKQGYSGESEEDTVDHWFTDVCRHVVLETFEQSEADISVGNYVNKKDLGDGKVEVS